MSDNVIANKRKFGALEIQTPKTAA